MGNTRARRAYIAIAQYGAYRGYVLTIVALLPGGQYARQARLYRYRSIRRLSRLCAHYRCAHTPRFLSRLYRYRSIRRLSRLCARFTARIRRDFYEGESIDTVRSSRRRVARGSDMELLSVDRAHKTAVNGAFYLTF